MRYHLSPVKLTNVKRIDNNSLLAKGAETEALPRNWWRYIMTHFNGTICQYQLKILTKFSVSELF